MGKAFLLAAVVILVIWGASRWVTLSAWWVNTRVHLSGGTFCWEPVYGAEVREPGVRVELISYPSFAWWYGWEEIRDDGHWRPAFNRGVCMWSLCEPWWFDVPAPERLFFAVMLWPVVVVLGAIGGVLVLWRSRAERRVRAGLCAGCGYSRAGLAGGLACPECGSNPLV